MGERLIFTFALTGRREWGHGTQGVALGYGLAGLSARAGPQTGLFPHNLHLTKYFNFEPPTSRVEWFIKSEPVMFATWLALSYLCSFYRRTL